MKRFITWFNRSAPRSAEPLPAITRAGIAHLYFESIHPSTMVTVASDGALLKRQWPTPSANRCWSRWKPSRSIAQVEFLIAKTKLLDRFRRQINARQEKALLRMFAEGSDGFKGGLTAGNYSTITGASPATTTRDFADLTEKGALIRTGERKHARYGPNLTGC